MINSVQIFYFVFAALVQIGGVIGFVKAKSKASLIAGLISGAVLDVAAVLTMLGHTLAGLIVGLIITVLLLGRFAPAFFKTKKFMPAGLIFILGIISLAISIVALIRI